ncbi:MAG: hypothetical protein ACRDYV_03250 [Acidimicrobiia bacterium]
MPDFDLEAYVPVSERVTLFRKDRPLWGLLSEVVADDGQRIRVRAWVTDETGLTVAVGHAEEVRGQGFVNRTSALENAETSAWGRALANLGYSVDRGIASREEMEQAQAAASPAPAEKKEPRSMTQGQLLAQAAAKAGFVAKKDDDGDRRKEIDTARRDVLQAVTGVRSSTEIKKAHDVKKALDAFEDIAAKRKRLAYDPDGKPLLVEEVAP